MKKEFTKEQKEQMEKVFKEFLSIVDDPERPGLIETPKRVVKYWCELLEGQLYTNQEIAEMYNKCFDLDEDVDEDDVSLEYNSSIKRDLVVETGIKVFSHCEHHLALMYDMDVTIAYIPKNKVIGLSKMGRIAEMCAKRLQLQEKLGNDINEVMRLILGTNDVAVVIKGKHGCMTARGVKNREAITKTASLQGKFKAIPALREEMYHLMNN
jgi:GTP cyclohydrolase I